MDEHGVRAAACSCATTPDNFPQFSALQAVPCAYAEAEEACVADTASWDQALSQHLDNIGAKDYSTDVDWHTSSDPEVASSRRRVLQQV